MENYGTRGKRKFIPHRVNKNGFTKDMMNEKL